MPTLRVLGIILTSLLLILLVGPFLVPVPPLQGTVPAAQLADADSRFVELNGVRVHYKQAGQGTPYLILLHGFGASLFSWREVMAPLAQVGTVVAYDRPAFGLTQRPLPGQWQGLNPYGFDAQVALVLALMERLGFRSAILVGNSAGGAIAAQVALHYPERVQALVLVDAAILSGGGAPARARPLLGTPQVRHLGPLFVRSIRTRGQELLQQAWHDPSRITPEVRTGYARPLQVENWDRALWEFTLASRPSLLETQLKLLRVPTLVITGDDDRIVPTEQSLRLAGAIPNAHLVVIPSAGHVPHEERPDLFMQALLGFLSEQ